MLSVEVSGPHKKFISYPFDEFLNFPGVYETAAQGYDMYLFVSIGDQKFLVQHVASDKTVKIASFSHKDPGGWNNHKFLLSDRTIMIKNKTPS